MKKLEKNYKDSKNNKKREDRAVPAKRLFAVMVFIFVLFLVLIIRIGWIQFVQGANLKELASRQQTMNKIISPTRGAIYDTNGKALAISAKVDTITINPLKIIVKNKPRRNTCTKRKGCKRLIRDF